MRRSVTDRILERLDVRAFYSEFTELSKPSQKGECRGLCPLHKEKTPSFWVNVHDGSFKCFGCGEGGGPIQFWAAVKGLSLFEASAQMLKMYGENGNGNGNGHRRSDSRKAVEKRTPRVAVAASMTSVTVSTPVAAPAEIYRALLGFGRPLAPKAIEYFTQRSIRVETLDRFQIAFLADPHEVERRLLDAFGQAALVRAGVFQEKDGRAWFTFSRHPILFPILKDGLPVFLQGRLLEPKEGAPKYCNLAGVQVPALLNLDRLMEIEPASRVFVCEGAPDTMILDQEGFPAVGIVGSSGFKPEWLPDLARFQVHLVLDNDAAGRSGTDRIAGLFDEGNRPVFVVKLPEGVKDANEFFLNHRAEEFEAVVRKAERREADLKTTVGKLLEKVRNRGESFSYTDLASRIYSWMESHGGVFLVDGDHRCFLMFDQVVYELGNYDPFNALMLSKTDLVPVSFPGRMVWQIMRSLCFLKGRREGNLSWIHSDMNEGVIYMNLHNQANQILALKPGRVELLPNGTNSAGIMLRAADKMTAIDFDSSANPKDSVSLLKELVMDPLACDQENRLFITCWLLAAFFLDFTADKALLKLSGHSGSGKTTAARILSCLLYGADHVESATVAYYYADAARNPYLICDNLETENMNTDITQFLLHVATGIAKGKRRAGTDSETVRESANALVAITAIEPLTKAELINRTYDIEFHTLFKSTLFMQRERMDRLVRMRGQILSGLFQLFAREVLPGFYDHRQKILARLEDQWPRHPKQRVNSFLTIMIVILRAILKLMDAGQDRSWGVVESWMDYQAKIAEETERDTNAAVYLLDALSREMLAKDGEFRREYYFDFMRTVDETKTTREVSFVASARDLLMALQILSKNKGFKLPFSNTKQLGVRLGNEAHVLEKAGWIIEREKIVNGVRYQRFAKRLI